MGIFLLRASWRPLPRRMVRGPSLPSLPAEAPLLRYLTSRAPVERRLTPPGYPGYTPQHEAGSQGARRGKGSLLPATRRELAPGRANRGNARPGRRTDATPRDGVLSHAGDNHSEGPPGASDNDGRGPAARSRALGTRKDMTPATTSRTLLHLQRSRALGARKDELAFDNGTNPYNLQRSRALGARKDELAFDNGTNPYNLQRSRALSARKDGVPLQYRWNPAWRAPARGPSGPRHMCPATSPSCPRSALHPSDVPPSAHLPRTRRPRRGRTVARRPGSRGGRWHSLCRPRGPGGPGRHGQSRGRATPPGPASRQRVRPDSAATAPWARAAASSRSAS